MRAINTFWNWFQDNNQTIKNILNETPKNQKHIFFWLNKHLHYYCKEIDFIIGFPKKPTDKTKLIITANGNPEYFKQVVDLIDNAPRLRTWIFVAFIQPMEDIEKMIDKLDNPYVFKGITIKASDLMFLPLNCDESCKKFDIMVYLKNYNIHCNTKTWREAIYIIMQDIFGENVYEHINFVQLAQLSDNEDDLIHLHDFQAFLDILNLEN
ncbi:hypothetical protein [Flavobacterium gawalongense]|uniref:Uncharacterized protein n=1 Tax=Flavobacterium gawalongense TaxID=2594432 RepID=A0A553BDF4_9FLAO|nr:hypothetical protein [Flavobacterium gawalongense]TRX01342.1 hypothetical protein FNW33_09520 [Flavobacterium gawalongense]TRX05866.1 hypothetical protein FNW12_09605 [Flavobacterium gawalongense]TRX06252.1 hypothetical protein FNW11_14765 [Flavobacterium gawalongense]TRX06996.1 hypothetical protein FNW10_15125 [Flavobacterium gawalongense]TRX23115.1 hypothetical protein FNW38_15195 [Flavobacterium gawalongense]